MIRRQMGYTSKDSRNTYQRHTGDAGIPLDDPIQLTGSGRYGARSITVISNSNHMLHSGENQKAENMAHREDIRVEKSFRVQINKSDSEHELNG